MSQISSINCAEEATITSNNPWVDVIHLQVMSEWKILSWQESLRGRGWAAEIYVGAGSSPAAVSVSQPWGLIFARALG